MTARVGYGATITIGGTNIGEVTSIGGLTKTREQINVTNLASADQYTAFANGVKDGGSVVIGMNLDPSEAGQLALEDALEDGTTAEYIITLPTAFGMTLTFNANVASFGIGEITNSGVVPASAELRITGKPTMGVTASNNITALTVAGGTTTLYPAFAQGTYIYVASTSNATVTFAATFAAGTCKLYEDDVLTQTLLTTVASANVAASTTRKKVELKVEETGKTIKTYTFHLAKTS